MCRSPTVPRLFREPKRSSILSPHAGRLDRQALRAPREIKLEIGQLECAARFTHGEAPQAKLDKLDALLAQTSTSPQDAGLLANLLSLPNDGRYPAMNDLAPEERRRRTLAELGAQLKTLAHTSTVLMILEDDPARAVEMTIGRL